MEEKIKAVVFKLIPCCLTLKPLVTSRFLTNLVLSKACSCCAQDECTVSASVGDHTRELLRQYGPVPPRRSLDTGQSRDATGSLGSGWPGAAPLPDTTSAEVPSLQTKSVNIYLSCCLTVSLPKPGLAPATPHPGVLQWAAPSSCPHTLCPAEIIVKAYAVQSMPLNTPSLLLENTAPGNPHQSGGRERGFSTRRQ